MSNQEKIQKVLAARPELRRQAEAVREKLARVFPPAARATAAALRDRSED